MSTAVTAADCPVWMDQRLRMAVNRIEQFVWFIILADRTATSMIGYWRKRDVRLSVCLDAVAVHCGSQS